MKQLSLAATEFELVTNRIRKRVFLDGMNLAVPGGLAPEVTALRLYPASPYGFDVPPFDTRLER